MLLRVVLVLYGGLAAEASTRGVGALLPRSPYAVTKLAGEHYARVFWELHGLETVCAISTCRAPAAPRSAVPAVIPLFVDGCWSRGAPVVQGTAADAGTSRSWPTPGAQLLHAPPASVGGGACSGSPGGPL